MSKNRILASIISNDTNKVKSTFTDSDSIVNSASLGVTAAAGTATYSSADTLPVSADDGDQALVTSTNRLYIFTNGGWYNIALVNTSPYFTTSAAATYDLSTTGAATTITLLAVDSEGINIVYTATTDSDFDGIATVTKDSDSGRVFTVIPTDSENGTAVTGTGTITFKASDGVNVASTLSTFSLTFIIIVDNSKHTSLLLKADAAGTDNQVDAGPTTHALTETGPITSTAFTPYHPGGYSTHFDGTNDWLVADLGTNIGDSDFTIEGWVKSDVNAHHGILQISGDTAGYTGTGYGNTLAVLFQSGYGWQIYGRGGAANSSGPTAITVNQWYHFAYVKTGGNAKLYIDGVEVITAADTTNYAVRYISIGRVYNANFDWTGHIKDVRVVVGTAVYTSSFTPPTEPLTAITNTKLLTCHLPYFSDGSADSRAITVNGQPPIERISPYDYLGYTPASYGGSVYFDDAANTYMVTGPSNHADFGFGTGDWTVEMWIWVPSGYTQGNNYIIDIGSNGLIFRIVNNKFTYTNTTLGYSGNLYTTGADFTNDSWHHMAVCRISGTVKMYMNGKETASETDTHNSSSTKVWFGRYGGSVSYQYTGYVSDLRIVKGTGVYTSNFTPPSEPLTAITNTVLLTCTNKNDIWDASGDPYILTKSGNATASNTYRQFTTSSAVYFDGTGDYLDVPASPTLAHGTGSFTIEFWMYATSIVGTQNIYDTRNASGGFTVNMVSGVVGFYGEVAGMYLLQSSALSADTWYHVAIVRNVNAMALYIDGTSVATATNSSDFTNTTNTIGARYSQDTQYYSGYLQDLRVSKGLARYTSNFTPPTVEFEG